MAKKKNRNKDFDSWLESINSNTYIPQMAQNAPNNANYFADGGPAMRFEHYDDGTGMMRSRMAAPTTDYNIANSPLMDYRTQGFDGTLKMDTLSRKDFDYGNMTPEQQTQFKDYNSNVRQNNKQYRQDVRDTKIADLNAKTDNGEGFLGKMNSNSGVNMGGIVGAAAETARVWSDPNSTALDKVGNLMGIANVSKLYTADTEKGDANINEMTGRLNDFKTNNIQDAWDTLGAGQALKLNKGPNQINLMSNNLGWKDFKRKNMLGLTLGAMGQGAASGGSVGGAWGAAGGALTGLFAGLGGMFTNKRRAKKAYKDYVNKLNYLNNNARMLNAQAQNEWRASNINAINNGVGQEKINDMANFRAYGGILDNEQNINAMGGYFDTFNLSPNMISIQNQSLDNQKYKYNNQIQPLGFFGNTNNKFSFGGMTNQIDPPPLSEADKRRIDFYERGYGYHNKLDGDDWWKQAAGIYEGDSARIANLYENRSKLTPDQQAALFDRLTVRTPKIMEEGYDALQDKDGNWLVPNSFDFGGSMNGMNIPTGMQSYDAGGTHEENPNGGVQVGVDQQGNPNLVEEGEFRWGDYIFSDRILVDEDILSLWNAELNPNRSTKRKAKKGKLTYADLARKYADKNKELVNDPIGKSTIDKYMENLSHAEEDQKVRDEEREYNNALANQTQDNPMYGSMKYNGMGNANAGLNEGNASMSGMDNSGLSNVNRSGNEMLHAFGGNLYPYGGDIYNMSPRELYATFGTTDLNVIQSMINQSNTVPETSNKPMVDANGNIITVNPQTGQMSNGTVIDPSTLDVNQQGYNYTAPTSRDFGLSLTGFNPTSGYLYTGNDLPYDIHYGTKVDAITGNPYLNNGTINPKWQEQGNKMLGNKLMPNGAHRDMYRFLDNSEFTPGMNNDFNGHGESNYVPRHLEANYQGPFGSTFREINPFNPDKPQTPPTNTPPVQDTPPAANVPPAKEGPNTNTGGGNSNTGNGGTPNPPDTRNGGANNSGIQSNIDVTGNPGNLNAQYAAGNPWQSTPYQEWTRFGAMAKGLPWVNSDAMGHTNWKYKIDNVPPDRMEALGRTGLALRNADHSGMFRAPDLMDVERQNNASQSFLANALRGISNVGGGNRGFVGAQSAAQNYNAQMGIGNNYATTNAYNADQKLKADEFNKQTEQFNANANNQMEADNQRAKQFAKTYEMTGLQNANAERLHERNYKDAVDRAAAADRANNVTNMWDNALEFMQGEAERNHQFNMANSNPINQYYWDKNKRQYIFKNDPNNPMLRMNNVLRSNNMGALSANSQKLLNSYIQQYGNNVPQELLDGLVEIEKQEQQRLADEKKATTNAGYRDLENEYDMLLADYARRMNTKAEDGTTPKFANYTQGDYGVFEDLRTHRPVDEKGNPISDEDYYSRLRMRANMMRNMMYGANSYYNNVTAYGGKICTKKKKQHYYMDV